MTQQPPILGRNSDGSLNVSYVCIYTRETDDEPVVSQELADYIEEHDRVFEQSHRDFEWTEASFFSQNGDIELQHGTFHEKST